MGMRFVTDIQRRDGEENGIACLASAFTAAEIGEMLKTENLPQWQDDFQRWTASFNNRRIVEEADTEADARAKMLVYLLENGITKSATV
jgi:hypothetical protein